MVSTYTVYPSELSMDFIRGVQDMFKDREIEISIREVEDETGYLLSSPRNREHLLRSLAEASRPDCLVTLPGDAL